MGDVKSIWSRVSNYQNDISQVKDSINDANENKRIINEQIDLYQKQIQDIKNGKLKRYAMVTKNQKMY